MPSVSGPDDVGKWLRSSLRADCTTVETDEEEEDEGGMASLESDMGDGSVTSKMPFLS